MGPRHLWGYSRLEDARAVPRINALYKEVWGPLHNFFLPSMKLVEKKRAGSRWVRRHDEPKTAYQRLVATGELLAKDARRLREQYHALDPFALAAEVDQRLRRILP